MLISPGGFQNDQFRGQTGQLGHQFFVAPGVVADCGDGRVRSDNRHVECGFRDIDTDEVLCVHSCGPFLANAGLKSAALVDCSG